MSMALRLATACAAALLAASAAARDLEGRVVSIQDGDTVTVLDRASQPHRIRIAGIDAPEKAQAFGTAAREHLARLAFGRDVEVRCVKRDRYGRDVCNVFAGARDLGLEQVRSGHAWWFRAYARDQMAGERETYAAAEEDARTARRGLWRDGSPTAPWDWRRQQRPAADARPGRT